jgi:hypothetical protein
VEGRARTKTVGGPDALQVQPHNPNLAGEGLGPPSYIGGTCRVSRSEQVTNQGRSKA